MSHRRSTVKGSLSFANPTVRAWLFQILAVVAVVGIIGWLFHNTVTIISITQKINVTAVYGKKACYRYT